MIMWQQILCGCTQLVLATTQSTLSNSRGIISFAVCHHRLKKKKKIWQLKKVNWKEEPYTSCKQDTLLMGRTLAEMTVLHPEEIWA